ncbi:uncharacterized protein LOC127083081 [Lathyrus oleraceus]|uniref:Uncharacterized protein n=1 Tax=Pisum sativum TaxID=3888 RepID=A0A9D4WPS5_PEA|nr:uncharacterized protein LOC127083081 [Pisum sativum]KAI5406271.1 hypothetical protein KIW84_052856 [Pisum sativum]
MPPSPAMRYSPGREARGDGHKRRHSLESGILFRGNDDDLALFNEMQTRERDSFLLQSSDDLEDSFATRLRHLSDVNVGISIPGRRGTSDLLNIDGDKNDYNWLLTPPDTPLFPSMDEDPPFANVASRGRQSKPISISRSSTMEKSRRSSRGSASPNRLSPSPRSGTNTSQAGGRPSSLPNYSPTSSSLRYATPSRRSSPPPNKPITPASRSSTFTPRRLSTGSSGSIVSSGVRGTSPVKTTRGNSSSPKIRAWQTNIPGFSSEAPPNLRTSLADRPATYVRGSSPASRSGKESTPKFSRQSMSPTASRSSSSIHSHDRDPFSSRSKGSVASSGDDDLDSLHSIPVGSLDKLSSRRDSSFSTNRTPAISKKSPRMMSPNSAPKKSFDSAFRQMDRKSPQNMFRPLLSSVPSTTLYAGNANSAHRSLVSRNSMATSSNATSDRVTIFAHDTEGIDHSQDDMASETDKMLYSDLHEEVFAFDKIDGLDANIEHEINKESVDLLQNQNKGPNTVFGPTDAEGNECSETSHVRDVISETGSFENTAICSQCGCCYQVIIQTEENIELCPQCSRKTTLLRANLPETVLAVSEGSSEISTNMPKEEENSTAETGQLRTASELSQFPLGEHGYDESETSCSELNRVHSQNSSNPSSLKEGGEHMPTNWLEMNQSGVDEIGDQLLDHYSDRPDMDMDPMEATGISVLLKRSSSNKGPIVRARTFTATTISYDDLSLSRDSLNSIRSSTRPGSYSASSSTDFSSTKQTEFHMHRQLSGRKLDADCGHDLRIKPPSTAGSSFSITSNRSHHEVGLANRETSGNTECSPVEDIPQVLHEYQASENTMIDLNQASPIDSTFVDEEKLGNDDSSRGNNVCSSELLSHTTGVRPDDNLVTSFPDPGDCISIENVEDHSDIARSVSNTETSVRTPESSCHENLDVQSYDVNDLNASVIANCSTITESEIKGEDTDLASKCALDDLQELSARNPSNDCHTASVSELNAPESHGSEESTVTVEYLDAGNTRSLTLEEATDTILFCSSIIHDLAYQAATIAMENECSGPFEGSEPTVTLLGKSVPDRKDIRRRPVSKRTVKTPKSRPKSVETGVKIVSGKTENDENIDESFTNNVGLPNKVDNSMKPPKLESKCNCIIM